MAKDGPGQDMFSWYEALYPAVEASRTYSRYCELVYGLDLSQQGFVTMGELGAMLDAVRVAPGERALDMGCGVGKMSEYVAQRTGAEVVGLDFSPQAIRIAKARTKDAGPSLVFQLGDMEEIEYGAEAFDVILAMDTLYFTDDLDALVGRVYRWLRPGGRMALFYGMPRRIPEDAASVLEADGTTLARALRGAGIAYRVVSLTDGHFAYNRLKRRIGEHLKDRFEAEGNGMLYEYIIRESIADDTPYEAYAQAYSRHLYLCEKPALEGNAMPDGEPLHSGR